MKRLHRRSLSWIALAAFVLVSGFALSPARATVAVEVPLEELAREAQAIVHAVVTRVGTRMVARGDRVDPHTIVDLRVRTWLKGSGGRFVRLQELGGSGRLGGLAIAGTPEYRRGDEVVAFLEMRDGYLRTLALAQGRFQVRRNVRPGRRPVVTRNLEGIGFARFDRKGLTIEDAPRSSELELSELLRVIELAREYGGNEGIRIEEPTR